MDLEMVARAWAQRPEALEAETRIARAEAELRRAKAELVADVKAVANYYHSRATARPRAAHPKLVKP